MSSNDGRSTRVTSLGELPREISPARDLWPQIAAELKKSHASRTVGARLAMHRQAFAALGALAAALAIGVWIGRGFLTPRITPQRSSAQSLAQNAAFVTDPRYVQARAELMRSLNERLAALPPQTRAKVVASLDTIHKSMQDIQVALGRDPGNALLQALLVSTYQDEMRVLTDVQDASTATGET